MRQYIRSSDGPIAAKAAAAGGDRWWDLRVGKGACGLIEENCWSGMRCVVHLMRRFLVMGKPSLAEERRWWEGRKWFVIDLDILRLMEFRSDKRISITTGAVLPSSQWSEYRIFLLP